MDDNYYGLQRKRKEEKSLKRFLRFKRDHRLSYTSSGKPCGCGNDHTSIDILDDQNGMSVIEHEVCPFMYGVRNACLRARFGNHIEKIDTEILQEVSRGH
jgi:hypothetical protein